MTRDFNIAGLRIGQDSMPLVIPEMGINHNGDLKVAFQMVAAAKRAGAKIIKHQTHIINDEMSMEAKKVIPGNASISIYDIMDNCALNEKDEKELKDFVESMGMVYLSTPFSRAAADRLEKLGVIAYKIGSGEMNHYPLLDYIASFGKPMIVSTGMNTIESVRKAVEILERRGVPFALLHTTNLYPTPPNLVRLNAMLQLMEEFKDIPIGLSDHTLNNNSCIAALALGAKIVERHFTDKMDRVGPDIKCSMDEEGLRELLLAANEVPQMLNGDKTPAKEEQVTIDFAFATLVTIKDIKKGDVFSTDNLWAKRPGTGSLLAERFNEVIGKKTLFDIPKDTHITEGMIE